MQYLKMAIIGIGIGVVPLMVGCSDPQAVVEVTGVVTLNGKPLELVAVEFWPDNGPRSFGKTDTEGKFTLQLDDRSKSGAVPGTHKVSLKDTLHLQDNYIGEGGDWVDMTKGRKSRIDSKYFDAPRSPVSVQVKSGEPNHFEFAVDARK
jgi:hypothetical protein